MSRSQICEQKFVKNLKLYIFHQFLSLALMSQDILQRFDDDAQREREKLNLNKLTSIACEGGAAHLSAYLDFVHRVIVEL